MDASITEKSVRNDILAECENEVKKDPYNLKYWWNYIICTSEEPFDVQNSVIRRALAVLPRSYKIWKHLLDMQTVASRDVAITHEMYDSLVETYEQALIHLNKMPVIWEQYGKLLMTMRKGTACRHAFDRALRALPITQHGRIWKLYLVFVKDLNVWETAVVVFRRYLMFEPNDRDSYVQYLLSIGHYKEASEQLAMIVNDESFVHKEGKTKHQLWMELCELVSSKPEQISSSLDVDAILRSGIRQFTDEVGRLWCSLASYYTRLGQFECARDIYEEGIGDVTTVRDFSMVFDAYSRFEEEILRAKMALLHEEEEEDDDDEDEYEDDDDLDEDGDDTELLLSRFEYLMERRPLLLNSVLLRQNPHNVKEWTKRIALLSERDDATQIVMTYTEAVKSIDPKKAIHQLHKLWIAFAKYYEDHDDLESARMILEKATDVPFATMDEVASIYCEWGEMELRHERYDDALEVVKQATDAKHSLNSLKSKRGSVRDRVYKSTKLWSFYLDLEESLGTFESTKRAYERCFSLKVITAQMLLNYTTFLQENKYYEDSFAVFERGLALFSFPQALDLWIAYLKAFEKRYAGTKLERMRSLFEQAVENVPIEHVKGFYLDYARFEETHGRLRNAMEVYHRAVLALEPKEKYNVYLVYLQKAEKFFGVVKTREIYEESLENLPDDEVGNMCLKFTDMERKLGELERARCIYVHGSQYCNPADEKGKIYWQKWNDFEIEFGNEQTFLEMLRIKRSVQTQYNYTIAPARTATSNTVSDAPPSSSTAPKDAMAMLEGDSTEGANVPVQTPDVDESDSSLKRKSESVSGDTEPPVKKQKENIVVQNPDEIDLDDMDDDDIQVEERAVPDAVFGSAKQEPQESADGNEKESLGALARFRKKKKE